MRPADHRRIILAGLVLSAAARGFAAPEETLQYELRWGPFQVGRAEVTTRMVEEDGRRLIRFRFTAQSAPWVATIYPVEDCIESFMDPETLLPIKLVKRTSEGWFRCDDLLTFDRERGIARWQDHVNGETVEYTVEPDTRDFFSLMYFLRDLQLHPGWQDRILIAADERTHVLRIGVRAGQEIALRRGGRTRALRLDVRAEHPGLFVRKIPHAIWVSSETPRVVVQMQVKVPVGRVRAVLAGPAPDGVDAANRPARRD